MRAAVPAINRNRLLIERMQARIPGFNRFSLSYAYLLEVCQAYGIKVLERPFELLHGMARQGYTRPYIIINSSILASDKVISLAHEFTHVTDQILDTSIFLSTGDLWNYGKYEFQCQVVGVLALMPEPEAGHLSASELICTYGVRSEIAEFRASLHLTRHLR